MKKIFSIVAIAILLIFSFIPSLFAIVEPTSDFYVNDYADILSEETEKFIQDNSIALNDGTTAQIVVVTVKSLDGKSIEEYATELFRSFGIGDKEKNNGLLILLSIEERLCKIEVGYGLEGILPDGKTGRIQDEYMIPYFKDDNFDEGMLNGYKAFYKEVAEEYNFDTSIAPVEPEEDFLDSPGGTLLMLKSVLVFIFFFIDFNGKKAKIKVFIFLEILTILITIFSFMSGAGPAALLLLAFGTVINILAVVACFGGISGGGRGGYYGGYSGRSHSSGGGGHSYHGGGGSSGGGGSTRSF